MEFSPVKEGFRSGFVAFVGRPNSGKSTLLNALVGHKVAITSPTAQTTRHRFRAVVTTEDYQLVIVDTPGIHKPHDALGDELNISAYKALEDVDIVAMLIDLSQPISTGDEWVASRLRDIDSHKVCILSKRDLVDDDTVQKQAKKALALAPWDALVVLSSVDGYNLDALREELYELLPDGPAWFTADMETDQPMEVVIAEFIREKLLHALDDEIPHAVGVVTDHLFYDEAKDLQTIEASIYVEHESQKGIVIGKGGTMIKQIGTEAREDLERLIGCQVFLDLKVKVKKNWRRDASMVRRFGYGEGA